jgi:hypothetical protein
VAVMLGVGLVVLPGVNASTVAAGPRFTDSFDKAVDRDPTYGLNDGLADRQRGEQRGVTYTRTSGVWYAAPPPPPWYSQVNHANRSGTLSFWLGHSAVRLDAPVLPGTDGRIAASTTVDPITGDAGSGQWASLVLTTDRANSGYVTNPQVDLGVIVGSNGAVTVFQAGAVIGRANAASDSAGRFTVAAAVKPGERTATVTVNSATATVDLATAFPSAVTLFLGAYLDDRAATTTFDHLGVSAVDTSRLTPPPGSAVRYFGYFATRLGPDTGNHLPEVAGRSTLNHVNVSDYARYAPEVLDSCRPASCAVYTGWEFFTGCDAAHSPNCRLFDNYQQRWQRLAGAISSRLDKVGAFYLLDEPYHRGARPADIATAARTIKQTFPGAKVMLVEAGYKVATIEVPAEVDWVGFDDYCKSVTNIEATLRTLEARTSPQQQLFLLPPAAPLAACGNGGYRTDADLAATQWNYLAIAERHPRVIGLMTFGLWVEGTQAPHLPLTIDAHERITARLTTG